MMMMIIIIIIIIIITITIVVIIPIMIETVLYTGSKQLTFIFNWCCVKYT